MICIVEWKQVKHGLKHIDIELKACMCWAYSGDRTWSHFDIQLLLTQTHATQTCNLRYPEIRLRFALCLYPYKRQDATAFLRDELIFLY